MNKKRLLLIALGLLIVGQTKADTCVDGCYSDFKVDWNKPAFEMCKAGCGEDFGKEETPVEQPTSFPACFKDCQECMKKCSVCMDNSKH